MIEQFLGEGEEEYTFLLKVEIVIEKNTRKAAFLRQMKKVLFVEENTAMEQTTFRNVQNSSKIRVSQHGKIGFS